MRVKRKVLKSSPIKEIIVNKYTHIVLSELKQIVYIWIPEITSRSIHFFNPAKRQIFENLPNEVALARQFYTGNEFDEVV